MSVLQPLFARLRATPARLVLVSGGDSAFAAAAQRIAQLGLGTALVVVHGSRPPDGDRRIGAVAELLRQRAPDRVRDGIHALDLAGDPVHFAVGLVALGEADAVVVAASLGGPAVEEAVRWLLRADPREGRIATLVYLLTPDDRLFTVAIPPRDLPSTPGDLAHLAILAADHRSRVVGDPLRIALLAGPQRLGVESDVEAALPELEALAPGIPAAIDRMAGWGRGGGGGGGGGPGEARFRGRPNILIFPDAVSGHLACRFVREFGQAQLFGSIYLGASGGVAGLSDQADADDIVAVSAIAALGRAGN